LTVPLVGTAFGVDFNPAADRLRIISDSGQNLAHNVNDGGVTVANGTLTYTPPPATAVPALGVTAAAYTNNDLNQPNTGTTLFDLDTTMDQVVFQSPPANGILVATGKLRVDATAAAGFDIYSLLVNGVTVANIPFATLSVNGKYRFYSVNLNDGSDLPTRPTRRRRRRHRDPLEPVALPTRRSSSSADDDGRCLAALLPEPARAHTKFRSERPIEVRDVAEAGVERDIEYFVRLAHKPRGCFAESRAQHVLMRRDTGHTLEGAKEMIRAQVCFSRQVGERQRGARMAVDRPDSEGHARFGVHGHAAPAGRRISSKPDGADHEAQREFLPRHSRCAERT
jgi:Domain of unknown function (DUF4394)